MQAYEIDRFPGSAVKWALDLAAVKANVATIPQECLVDARVTLRELDKPAVVALLNGETPAAKPVALRRWRLSPRAQLVEINVSEDSE